MDLLTVRSSSWADLMDCAARWKARNLLGLRLPTAGAAWLGTSLHHGAAVYDQAQLDGAPVSVDDAAGALVEKLHHPDEDVVWDDSTPGQIEPIALRLLTRYCSDVAPARDYAAVELTCEALDVAVPEHGVIVRMTGTTDRVRKTGLGGLAISDIKSGARAVGTDGRAVTGGHAIQLGAYELLAEHALGLPVTGPAEIIGLQTATAARVGTAEVPQARGALVGTDEQPGMIEMAARMFRHDIFPGNPKSMLCSAKFCPIHSTCVYRGHQ